MNFQKGNYVLTEYGICQIKHIVFDRYMVIGKNGRSVWAKKVEPVPLTEDWFINFGFNRMYPFVGYGLEKLIIHYFNGEWVFNYGKFKIIIKYVNKLQDLTELLTEQKLELINPIEIV